MPNLPILVELQLPITLNDVLKKWSHQACQNKDISSEERENKYMDALLSLFSMFAIHHSILSDEHFVRSFRFFKDAGLSKRLSKEAPIAERYSKLDLVIW